MPDVVVVGGYIADFSCFTPRFPKAGETICGKSFISSHGGKGANQCVSVARLGGSTAFISSLGADSHGKEYVEQLKVENVDVSKVILHEGIHSGLAQITVADSGENTIIYVPGAIALLSPADVDDAAELIRSARVLLCQFEIRPPAATLRALQVFKGHGLSILNGAPAIQNPNPELLTLCDIFCVNETEAEIMTGVSVTNLSEAQTAVDKLLSRGCNSVILTLGAMGAVYASKSNRKILHVPTQKVTPIDTTGAGDAFLGSLAYFVAYYPNLSMEEMIRRACYVASQSVLKVGTQANFPYKKDLPAELFSH